MQNRIVCLVGGGLEIGGQERALVFLANELAQKGCEVVIISLFKTNIEFKINDSIKIFIPHFKRADSNRLIYAFRIIFYIRKLIRQNNPDSIICFGDWFNAFTIIATKGFSSRMIITNRMGPNLFLGNFIETMNKIFYRFADELIVQTERAKDILSKKYKVKKITVIPNPVELTTFDRAIKKKQIISVGRLSKEKGQKTLIKAFSNLKEKEWTLHIVGDGFDRPSLEILVKDLQIENRVVFHGKMYNFNSLLLESQIFVLPSLYEGFPNALLEAMSFGLCCLASDCIAGPSEIIQNGLNGLLFEPGNTEQLTKLLEKIIEDNPLREQLASNAAKSLERFDKNVIIQQFEKVLL